MRYSNIYYLVALLAGITIFFSNTWLTNNSIFFYGLAENKETEINFNYPVVVEEILVSPGEAVKAGETLLRLKRVNPKESMADQGYRIAELQAKASLWRSEKEGELQMAQSKKKLRIAELNGEIAKLREESRFKNSLFEGLSSIGSSKTHYTPLTNKIKLLKKERSLLSRSVDQEIRIIKSGLELGENPYEVEIERLEAERQFELESRVIDVDLKAPIDGVIGNVFCKKTEHIPSFRTLIVFYEQNPIQVNGYVHEDQILNVTLGDSMFVRSAKDGNVFCKGKVTGLGSRIIEIPERLRKFPDFKTYGREISVSIPARNKFLQKEKVGLEIIN